MMQKLINPEECLGSQAEIKTFTLHSQHLGYGISYLALVLKVLLFKVVKKEREV
jgi:hypothetical protein